MKKKITWKSFVWVTIPFIFVTFLFSSIFQSCQKEEIIKSESVMLKSATIAGPLTFFTTTEEFPCTGLPTEDFEKATNDYPENVYNPLDANTSTWFLPAGGILPGISFTSTTDAGGPYPGSADLSIWAWYAAYEGIEGHSLICNHQQETLNIEFTEDNVNVVGMTLITAWAAINNFDINVYGIGDALLGSTTVSGGALPNGTYFGVQSEAPIKKITIFGLDPWNSHVCEGIDDVTFGTCVSDTDGDGCPDSDDALINSNMEEFVNLGGCSNGVLNRMTLGEPCGTMMSDMIDVLEKGTYKNHGEFTKQVGKLTEKWINEGLITLEEKELIESCAAESSIGVKK